ncbi:DUF2637 domain-containing protein [Streptomyces chartreusis]|uniref:DUF2637 domain-containing protein n=1 Tax=Streptomyces chartreusis TaxID=1969 RepID=A0A7H8TA53_STRCX|nr:DUF2637 domain-containing protein [Streptomyces chartreusis]
MAVIAALAVWRSRAKRATIPSTVAERAETSKARRDAWRRGLSVAALGAGCLMLFAIAGTAGWLSFAAQRGYAHSRNGGDWDAATGFALLLDAGTLGLSLFRFFEALTVRSSALTRLLLIGFVAASAQMNYLHAPANANGVVDFGSRFVAVVPPLVYAVLLEMLLFKIEQVIMGKRPKRRKERERGYSLLLWVPFIGYPRQMWAAWRADLHSTLQNVRAPGSLKPAPARAPADAAPDGRNIAPTLVGVAQPSTEAPAPTTSPVLVPEAAAPLKEVERVTSSAPALMDGALSSLRADSPPRSTVPAQRAEGMAPSARVARPTSMKELLLDGLIREMRLGNWDAVSTNAVVRRAACVRVNMQLGHVHGRETLMTHDSARNAFRELAPDLRRAADEIRAQQHLVAGDQQPSDSVARQPEPVSA